MIPEGERGVYDVDRSIPVDFSEFMRKDLLNEKKLVECIKTRVNLSALGQMN
jgi:hypothetical protein